MTSKRVPEAITRLRAGKQQLRAERREMSLPDKVKQVVELQKIHVTAIRRRRELAPLERVWRLY